MPILLNNKIEIQIDAIIRFINKGVTDSFSP